MRFAAPALILMTALASAADTQPAPQKPADAPELIAGLSKMPKEIWPVANETAARKKDRGAWVMKFLLQQSGKKMHFSGELVSWDVIKAVVPPPPGMRPPRGVPPPPGWVPPKLATRLAVNLAVDCGDVKLWDHVYHIKAQVVPANISPVDAVAAKWTPGDTAKMDGPVGGISLESIEPDTIIVTLRDTATFTVTPAAAPATMPAPATRP